MFNALLALLNIFYNKEIVLRLVIKQDFLFKLFMTSSNAVLAILVVKVVIYLNLIVLVVLVINF